MLGEEVPSSRENLTCVCDRMRGGPKNIRDLILFRRKVLDKVIGQYATHCHPERNHQRDRSYVTALAAILRPKKANRTVRSAQSLRLRLTMKVDSSDGFRRFRAM